MADKISAADKEQIVSTLASTSWFNGGAGLLVPKPMAELFIANGITENYSVHIPF